MDKCKVEGCSNQVTSRGKCSYHLEQDNLYIENVLGIPRTNPKEEVIRKCSIEGCNENVMYRTLCKKHYVKQLREEKKNKKCTVEGCNDGQMANGYCHDHYKEYDRLKKKALELGKATDYFVLNFKINTKVKKEVFESFDDLLIFERDMGTGYERIDFRQYIIRRGEVRRKGATIEYFKNIILQRKNLIRRLLGEQ